MRLPLSARSAGLLIALFLGTVVSAVADKNNKFYFRVDRYSGPGVAYFDRALKEIDRGNLEGAIRALDAAVKADPQMWMVWFARGQVYMQLRKYDSALLDINEAGRLKPQFKRTFVIRAEIYRDLGRCADALADLDRVISLHGNDQVDAMALTTRAWIRAGCQTSAIHDPRKAVSDATAACNLDAWHTANYIDTLAYAYAANGDFRSAVNYERKAIDSGKFLPDEMKRAQEHLAYYEKRAGR
jgi:tetratricopeptide (TPR) repeat protein